ncbi:MBL fold metallo-hydrolase [Simiduia aestuariiviva]|uniref:Glyoxylase-like metal-dependent hydrolase (Beta-lactamase superfamily II) n=1 Tax=Simiduia aestuariiviva TaxID=1510459 RepID=A0A839UPC9_9GAMM|nr:MBL fold metallo-hydrolase [Simiduia aestuariiviva]MBB3168581.1 glyoxylase-like metal-dependent hydrolase (beta-lactamase superfamily II) [Simiduia aestuariiviva]
MSNLLTSARILLNAAYMAVLVASVPAMADAPKNAAVQVVPVQDGIYMLAGAGGNIGLSVGKDGAFLVDDQFAPVSKDILAAIATVSEQPVKFLINTHWHYDHTGGNENFGKQNAIIVAHKNVRTRLAAGGVIEAFKKEVPPAPEVALPVITFEQAITFHFNGETIDVTHPAPAHTDGDAIIYFNNANVVHMGDTFFNGFYPFIDASSGGNMLGVIEAVAAVLARIDDQTKVIPGHGRLSNKQELKEYHAMLNAVHAKVAPLKKAGKSVAEVVALKPTAAFDGKWGKGFLTPDQWVAIIYEAI